MSDFGLQCADCSTHFQLSPGDMTGALACPECGGKRFFRNQPSPTESEGTLRDMVDSDTQIDQGGNPLGEGTIMGQDGEKPAWKRDNFMHGRVAAEPPFMYEETDIPPELTLRDYNKSRDPKQPKCEGCGHPFKHMWGQAPYCANCLAKDPALAWNYPQEPDATNSPTYATEQVEMPERTLNMETYPFLWDWPQSKEAATQRTGLALLPAAAEALGIGAETAGAGAAAGEAAAGAGAAAEGAGAAGAAAEGAGAGGAAAGDAAAGDAAASDAAATDSAASQAGQDASQADPAASDSAGSDSQGGDPAKDGRLKTWMKKGKGALMKGALQGAGFHEINDLLGGNSGNSGGQGQDGSNSGGTGIEQAYTIPQLGSVNHKHIPMMLVADLETPNSTKSVDEQEDDPEKQDQKEFNDGDKSPSNPKNPNTQDSGKSGEDAAKQKQQADALPDTPGIDRLQLLMPLVMHYFMSDESGESDPLISALHQTLESEDPGYLDRADHPDSQNAVQLVIQHHQNQKQPRGVHAAGPTPDRCPHCSAHLASDGFCPVCGAKAHPQGVGQGQPVMAGQRIATGQGPVTPEQIASVQQLLINWKPHSRAHEAPQVELHPENYAKELAMIAHKPNVAPQIEQPPPQPMPQAQTPPPAMDQASGGMPVPDPSADGAGGQPMQPMASRRKSIVEVRHPDNPEPYRYQELDDPALVKAIQKRFGDYSPVVHHPTDPHTIIHNPGNFWDGPRHLKNNGDGTATYNNPYSGDEEFIQPELPKTPYDPSLEYAEEDELPRNPWAGYEPDDHGPADSDPYDDERHFPREGTHKRAAPVADGDLPLRMRTAPGPNGLITVPNPSTMQTAPGSPYGMNRQMTPEEQFQHEQDQWAAADAAAAQPAPNAWAQYQQGLQNNPAIPSAQLHQGMVKEAPGNKHLPGASPKRNRQYEDIKQQYLEQGLSEEEAAKRAAMTVNKQRSEKGETKKKADFLGDLFGGNPPPNPATQPVGTALDHDGNPIDPFGEYGAGGPPTPSSVVQPGGVTTPYRDPLAIQNPYAGQPSGNFAPQQQFAPQQEQQFAPQQQAPQQAPQQQAPLNFFGSEHIADANTMTPRCPNCNSGSTTVDIAGDPSDESESTRAKCHSCQKIFDIAKLGHMIYAELPNPALVSDSDRHERSLHREHDPAMVWKDNEGNALQENQIYELHSPAYPVPDMVQVVYVHPDDVGLKLVGEVTNLGQSAGEPDIKVTRQEAQLEHYTFVPSEVGGNIDQRNDEPPPGTSTTPGEAQMPPSGQTTDEYSNTYPQTVSSVVAAATASDGDEVEPDEGMCHKCGSVAVDHTMSSPTTTMHECVRCAHAWETKDEFQGREAGVDLEWLLHDSGPGGDDFHAEYERHRAMAEARGVGSRNLSSIAAKDERLQAIKETLDSAHQQRVAGKNFTPAERRELINEHGHARNLANLDLDNTHYDVSIDYSGKANGMNAPDEHLFLGL